MTYNATKWDIKETQPESNNTEVILLTISFQSPPLNPYLESTYPKIVTFCLIAVS